MLLNNIETERLVFRSATMADTKTFMPFFEHKHARRFWELEEGQTWADLCNFLFQKTINRYKEENVAFAAICLKNTKEFIGLCGLLWQEVDGIKELEVGYHFIPQYWGNGYATEAAIASRNAGFKHYDVDSIISIINVENTESIGVAERNGMRPTKHTVKFNQNVCIYRITRAEWLKC